MTIEPLLAAAPVIQAHALAAIAALVLGIWQLAAGKGTGVHRFAGWIWAGLMLVVAVTSLWIHELHVWGPWSPIHLLSLLVIVAVPAAVFAARRHQVARHRRAMIQLFFFALVVAGAFTLLPGRIMHAVVFGG
jgi:uncharacterized membrane protein